MGLSAGRAWSAKSPKSRRTSAARAKSPRRLATSEARGETSVEKKVQGWKRCSAIGGRSREHPLLCKAEHRARPMKTPPFRKGRNKGNSSKLADLSMLSREAPSLSRASVLSPISTEAMSRHFAGMPKMLSPVLANLCKSNQYFRDSGAYSGVHGKAGLRQPHFTQNPASPP